MSSKKKTFFSRLEKGLKIILGAEVSIGDVIYCIEESNILQKDLDNLSKIEKRLARSVRTCYDNVTLKHKVDEALNLKVSLDINNDVGVICHLAQDLTYNKLLLLVGKLTYLTKEVYKDKVILLIIGDKIMQKSPIVKDLRRLSESIDVNFYFLETKKNE